MLSDYAEERLNIVKDHNSNNKESDEKSIYENIDTIDEKDSSNPVRR